MLDKASPNCARQTSHPAPWHTRPARLPRTITENCRSHELVHTRARSPHARAHSIPTWACLVKMHGLVTSQRLILRQPFLAPPLESAGLRYPFATRLRCPFATKEQPPRQSSTILPEGAGGGGRRRRRARESARNSYKIYKRASGCRGAPAGATGAASSQRFSQIAPIVKSST